MKALDFIHKMASGTIQLATGPMFSGKTQWLIKNLQQTKNNPMAIRFAKDIRYSGNSIISHDGLKIPARTAANVEDIKRLVRDNTFSAFGIDEVQFFDLGIVNLLSDLKKRGVAVYASGLDLDFKRENWETTEKITHIADEIFRFQAICSVCKQKKGLYSKRISTSSERIVIGGNDIYEARCEEHFEIS